MNFAFLLRSIKTSAKGAWLMIEHEVARKKLYQKCWGLKDLPLKIFLTFLKRGTKNRFLKENYFSIMLDFISAQIHYYYLLPCQLQKIPSNCSFIDDLAFLGNEILWSISYFVDYFSWIMCRRKSALD